MNRGLIGTIIGVLVIIILVIVILQGIGSPALCRTARQGQGAASTPARVQAGVARRLRAENLALAKTENQDE